MKLKEYSLQNTLKLVPLLTVFLIYMYFNSTDIQYNLSIKILVLIFTLLAPSAYYTLILGKVLKIDFIEAVIIDMVLSALNVSIIYTGLTHFIGNINASDIYLFTLLSTLFSYIIYNHKYAYQFSDVNIVKISIEWISLITSALAGFYLIFIKIPLRYWHGADTWENTVIIRELTKQHFTPQLLNDYYIAFVYLKNFGFYYISSAFKIILDISSDTVIRYGCLIIGGLCVSLTFLIIRRLKGNLLGLYTSIILLINPFMNVRFAMTIRENVGFIYMLTLFLIILIREQNGIKEYIMEYSLLIGLLNSVILIIHPLTSIISIFITSSYIIKYYYENKYNHIKEIFISLIISSLLIMPYYNLLIMPFYAYFFKNNSIGINLIIIIPILLMLSIFILRDKFKSINLEKFYNLVITMSLTIVIIVFFKKNLLSSENWGSIQPTMFSTSILITGIFGLVTSYKKHANHLILALLFFLSSTLFSSMFGVNVPIIRLSIYLIWIASYYSASLLDNIVDTQISAREIILYVKETSIKELANHIYENRKTVIIILLVLIPLMNEVSSINRLSINYYTEVNIIDARGFIQILSPEDLVIPQKLAERLFYYIDTPRENIVKTQEEDAWLLDIYDSSTPYELCNNLPESLRDKKRLHFVSTKFMYYFYNEDIPSRRMLEAYGNVTEYGTIVDVSFKTPFFVDDMPPENIKYIGNYTDNPIINTMNRSNDDSAISSYSNCIFSSKDKENPFKIFYIGNDSVENNSRIGFFYSKDGITWMQNPPHTIKGNYLNPYIIEYNESYHIYCEKNNRAEIVYFNSSDGINFNGPYNLIVNNVNYHSYEVSSPTTWIDEKTFYMIFSESILENDYTSESLTLINSTDGLNWEKQENMEWELIDERGFQVDYRKIILNDVIKNGDEYVFYGKFFDKKESKWCPASFHLKHSLNDERVFIRSLDVENTVSNSSQIVSINALRNPQNKKMYFYYHNQHDENSSINGLYLGYIKDYPIEELEGYLTNLIT